MGGMVQGRLMYMLLMCVICTCAGGRDNHSKQEEEKEAQEIIIRGQ